MKSLRLYCLMESVRPTPPIQRKELRTTTTKGRIVVYNLVASVLVICYCVFELFGLIHRGLLFELVSQVFPPLALRLLDNLSQLVTCKQMWKNSSFLDSRDDLWTIIFFKGLEINLLLLWFSHRNLWCGYGHISKRYCTWGKVQRRKTKIIEAFKQLLYWERHQMLSSKTSTTKHEAGLIGLFSKYNMWSVWVKVVGKTGKWRVISPLEPMPCDHSHQIPRGLWILCIWTVY